jgi:CMP/dCMP kinase
MSNSFHIIAIDGPAGSGKSTTAGLVASKLNFIFLDTGAMYRAVTFLALECNIDLSGADTLAEIARKMKIEFKDDPGGQKIIVDGRDLSKEIRTDDVTASVSEVSAHACVRKYLVAKQKEIGSRNNIVAEGRDTTSVVFPDATLKVYLVASIEERARRRVLDFERMGRNTSIEEQMEKIKTRDDYDSNREISPLTKTSDSIPVDTTGLTIEQQVDKIIELYREKISI